MNKPDFNADLAFVHLSDIHFRKGRMGDAHDADSDLRNELERDLRTVRTTRIQKLDGIIVSGDIAFAGSSDEFTYARGWLEKIRELVDCPKTGIMTTPGNHDIDRAAVEDGGDVDKLHSVIRETTSLPDLDAAVAGILRDDVKGPLLVSSMTAYNAFAKEYGCGITPVKPYWERDFALASKWKLRIRGMTSTLISGPRDHVNTHKLVYGAAQRMLLRENGVFRIVVGHHPPSWTLEGDEADRAFSDRAAIQLFGHKHDNWYLPRRGIRVIAGAVHPERRESSWEPRYSVLAVRIDDDGQLMTRVYPRRWSKEETMFIPDYNSQGLDYRDHTIEPDAAV